MDPNAYLAAAEAAFARAAGRAAVHDVFLRIAGASVRLRVIGAGLLPAIEPPFRHLRAPAVPRPDLGIVVADHRETGVDIPPPPWLPPGDPAAGRFRGAHHSALAEAGGAQVWMLDHRSGTGFLWIRSAAEMPIWDRIHPLRQILGAWAAAQSLQLMHAGAVGFDGAGVLLVGAGGSGKSTVVLACIDAGALAAGDDYVLVEHGAPTVAHSVYGTMRLFEGHARRFPFLMPESDSVAPGHDGAPKLTANVALRRPESLIASLPLAAIVMPRVVAGGKTRLRRENGGAALFAVAPNTLHQVDPKSRAAFERMARLCKTLPCWRLELGADLNAVPGEIRRAIAASATAAV